MNRFDFYSNINLFKEKESEYLQHHGIKGQKWGTRRWQYADGRFNEAGKERYFGKASKNSSEDDKVNSGLFSKNLSKENKDKKKEKNYIHVIAKCLP